MFKFKHEFCRNTNMQKIAEDKGWIILEQAPRGWENKILKMFLMECYEQEKTLGKIEKWKKSRESQQRNLGKRGLFGN